MTRFLLIVLTLFQVITIGTAQELNPDHQKFFIPFGFTIYRYVCSVDGLNLRDGKGTDSNIIDTIRFGEQVIVVDKLASRPSEFRCGVPGNWVRVEYNDLKGWVFDAYLSKRFTKIVNSDQLSGVVTESLLQKISFANFNIINSELDLIGDLSWSKDFESFYWTVERGGIRTSILHFAPTANQVNLYLTLDYFDKRFDNFKHIHDPEKARLYYVELSLDTLIKKYLSPRELLWVKGVEISVDELQVTLEEKYQAYQFELATWVFDIRSPP